MRCICVEDPVREALLPYRTTMVIVVARCPVTCVCVCVCVCVCSRWTCTRHPRYPSALSHIEVFASTGSPTTISVLKPCMHWLRGFVAALLCKVSRQSGRMPLAFANDILIS